MALFENLEQLADAVDYLPIRNIRHFFLGIHDNRIKNVVLLIKECVYSPSAACTFPRSFVLLAVFMQQETLKDGRETRYRPTAVCLNVLLYSLEGFG